MTSDKPIRILSVEDHPVVREGLSTLISSQRDMLLVAQVATGEEAVAQFGAHKPDVTLMDLRLPGMNGADALIAIRREYPQARILMFTTSDESAEIQRALLAGAAGYLLKSTPKSELFTAIRNVHAGRRYIPGDVAAHLAGLPAEADLSPRDLEILSLIRDGYRDKDIAEKLQIPETTVSSEIKNIVDKLQAKDRTHAVVIAVRRGLIQI